MDAVAPKEKRFLPALADAIADWFPQLERRALAVSEVDVTKENVPTLPLAMVAFVKTEANPPTRSSNAMFDLADYFVIEFWLEPERYKRANGSETPFWSYYPYDVIRNTLLRNLARWEPPNGERIAFRGLTIDAEPLAVTLTFSFIATIRWSACIEDEGEPFEIGWNLCQPRGCEPEPVCMEPWYDPCK